MTDKKIEELLGSQVISVEPLYKKYMEKLSSGSFEIIHVEDMGDFAKDWSDNIKDKFYNTFGFKCDNLERCVVACESFLVSDIENKEVLGQGINSVIEGTLVKYLTEGKEVERLKKGTLIIPTASMFCACEVILLLVQVSEEGVLIGFVDGTSLEVSSVKEIYYDDCIKGEIEFVEKGSGVSVRKPVLSIKSFEVIRGK